MEPKAQRKASSVSSSASKVPATCPMCGVKWVSTGLFYTGHLPARLYCYPCRDALRYRPEHDPHHPRQALAMVR